MFLLRTFSKKLQIVGGRWDLSPIFAQPENGGDVGVVLRDEILLSSLNRDYVISHDKDIYQIRISRNLSKL